LLLLTVVFAMVFVQSAVHWVQRRGRPLVTHPMSAAFAFVLYFSSIRLPPYPIHLEHWVPLVAVATGIRDGAWPLVSGTDAVHGPLSPVLLAAWLAWFGLSALSLSAAAMIGNLVAGMASFALIRRLTGSRAVAMLGASYALLETTAIRTAPITFPAPAEVALAMLLLYMSLSDREGRPWPAFLFGLILAWNPLFGAFAALGFLLALGSQLLQSTGDLRATRMRAIFAMLAGSGLSMATILVARTALALSPLDGNAAPIPEDAFSLFRTDSPAPQFVVPFLPLFIPGLLLLALLSRRSRRSGGLTARRLFVGASLVCAVPSAFFAAVRLDPFHSFEVYWVLTPTVALAIYSVVRLLALSARFGASRRIRAALSMSMAAMVLVVLFDILFPIHRLNQVVARYATGYEFERQKWYKKCASGQACDPDAKPSLIHHLRQASRPISKTGGTKRDPM